MPRVLLLMATTIVSALAVFSDSTGHGNQSHLVYAATQQRWWCFVVKTKTATVVSSYVSSSNDLTTATWSASTDSPALPRAMTTNDQRNLGVAGFANGSTDVAHLDVGITTNAGSGFSEHIRCTFTGASSISWDAAWVEVASAGTQTTWDAVKGNAVGVSTTSKFLHAAGLAIDGGMDANARKNATADTGATWTAGAWGRAIIDSSIANTTNSYALAPLASDVMVCVYENGGAANPNCTGLRYVKSNATGTWVAGTGTGDVGIGASSQDLNDWCLCAVDTTHVYAFRRDSASTYLCRKFDGTSWTTPGSTVPTQAQSAGTGLFAATDGTDLYLFVLDSTGNNAIKYVKGATANGTISFGAWTQLEAAGAGQRTSISGYPVVSNSQIGVIWTEVNGVNLNTMVSALNLAAGGAAQTIVPQLDSAVRMLGGLWPNRVPPRAGPGTPRRGRRARRLGEDGPRLRRKAVPAGA